MNIIKEIDEWKEQKNQLYQRSLQLIDEKNFFKLEKILDIYFNILNNDKKFSNDFKIFFKNTDISNGIMKDLDLIKDYCKCQESKNIINNFLKKISG